MTTRPRRPSPEVPAHGGDGALAAALLALAGLALLFWGGIILVVARIILKFW